MPDVKNKYDAPAARTVIRMVEELCRSGDPLGVSELSARLGASTNMTFRLLQTLEAAGWIVRCGDGTKYAVSLVPFHYASMPLGRMNLTMAANGPMTDYVKATGECIYLGVLDRDEVLYVIHHEATGPIKVGGKMGERYKLHAAAAGKVLLAHCSRQEIDRILSKPLERFTKHTRTTPAKLRAELERIRREDVAVDREEYFIGGVCCAYPVRDHSGKVVAALGTTALASRFQKEGIQTVLGPRLRAVAEQISITLGYGGPKK